MRGRLALWLRAQIELGVFETKADISAFVLNTVLVATALATAAYLMVAAILAHFGFLPYSFRAAIGFGGSTTIVIAASVTALLAWLVGTAIHELSLSRAELERQGRLDALSGLYNRRAFTEAFAATAADGFFVLFDVDRFKAVNNRHGHAVGDDVVVAVSQELRRVFLPAHLVGRFDGGEFAVFIRDGDRCDCWMLVEEARRSVATRRIEADGGAIAVTLSAGIADRTAGRPLEAVLEAAGQALHLAKSLGRDRVVHEDEGETLLAKRREGKGDKRRR
ncbi:GGDEF domain-containing protein [Shinella sp. BYT-45]|uniref:GGDEF domain-containing protein n=1 Tax=Shinella sp. BYT-45 TaxID=3377377 RepID=UPI00398114B6